MGEGKNILINSRTQGYTHLWGERECYIILWKNGKWKNSRIVDEYEKENLVEMLKDKNYTFKVFKVQPKLVLKAYAKRRKSKEVKATKTYKPIF